MSVILKGLSGSDPLSYLASLGLLRVLSRHSTVTMRWCLNGTVWKPEIVGLERDEAIHIVREYFTEFSQKLPIHLLMIASLTKNLSVKKFLDFRKIAVERYETGDTEPLLFASAYGDVINEEFVPTAWAFTNGGSHLETLDTERKLIKMVQSAPSGKGKKKKKEEDAVLFDRLFDGPWDFPNCKLIQRWSPKEDRSHANQIRNPNADPPRTNWAANLLAFEALPLFPVYFYKSKLATTGFSRFDNNVFFTWAVWTSPVNIDVVRSLVSSSLLCEKEINNDKLSRMGVATVFRSMRIQERKGCSFRGVQTI